MHEISLVRNIFATIEAQHPDIPPENILCIYLQVGELSNVEPMAMQNAFKAVQENDTRYPHARLDITVTPVLIYCDDCKKTSGIKNYHFVCRCGKPSKKIVQGDELLISRIEYESP
ncbi:MAG: hydrogenase maturation nickel metallochaperone HypA [Saprospiraceae bacterium]|nr:hydrogenase maturation nickel metallochaperone HypA [Saprospiraceae bacterium]